MDRLFSSTSEKDEELNQQVANDIEEAKKNGEVDTDELKFKDEGNGTVSILDKENGETTMAEKVEGEDVYDLYPAEYFPTDQPEKFIHPEGVTEDGVIPGNQQGAPDEHVEEHLDGQGVAESNEPGNVEETAQEGPAEETCPECGKEPCECEKKEDEEKSFCDSTNTVVQKIFSDQVFYEKLFDQAVESEETSKIGNLKIEKVDDDTVLVTDEKSGDAAKIVMDDDEMEITELDSKNFSEEGAEEYPEEYAPLHVVGVDSFNHVLVDAPEFDPESAQELAQQLTEDGVDGVEIFDNESEARDYAIDLLGQLGAQHEDDIEEPQEMTYSDHTIYLTRYYSDNTYLMDKMFSEVCCDIDASQSKIEDAIENGDEIETDTEIITPIDSKTAVVEDKDNDGEYTKVVIEDDNMNLSPLSEDEAVELMKDIEVEDTDDDEDEREYSDIWCDEDETRFFSENEIMTDYMARLFSEDANEEEIVDAIKSGDEIENDSEIITPVDANTAVIEDKDNGEYTLAKLDDDEEGVEVNPISEEEATDLMEDLEVEDKDEKDFSDVWCNEEETKFFSESEVMTDYMTRLFSGDADEEEIVDAIENGNEIENDTEVITPIDANTAVIEDKKNSEYTLAKLDEDKDLDVKSISEEEAKDLTEDLEVEDTKEKSYSTSNPILDKFFADAVGMAPAGEPEVIPAMVDPATGQLVPVDDGAGEDQPQMTVEAIEDKALAAVQSIQAAAAECEATILNAKAAPAETEQANLQEAQFSETDEDAETQKTFSDNDNTLVSWLNCHEK